MEGGERTRIFMKVKEKLDDELQAMHDRVKVIDATKIDLDRALQIELENRNKAIELKEREQREQWEREQAANKIRMDINTLLQELQE